MTNDQFHTIKLELVKSSTKSGAKYFSDKYKSLLNDVKFCILRLNGLQNNISYSSNMGEYIKVTDNFVIYKYFRTIDDMGHAKLETLKLNIL